MARSEAGWGEMIWFSEHPGDCREASDSSVHFLESTGTTTADEEFRSWHALDSSRGPTGRSATVQYSRKQPGLGVRENNLGAVGRM
jgi:hypothetical protein